MVTWGFSDLKNIDSSTLRPYVDPFYFEFHAAYIDINNLFGNAIPRFDLRIGRQVVPWGAADKFNPIANVNTLDLRSLMFGRALANNMVRADWNPVGDLNITAVLVPVFRPAQLPRTAPCAARSSAAGAGPESGESRRARQRTDAVCPACRSQYRGADSVRTHADHRSQSAGPGAELFQHASRRTGGLEAVGSRHGSVVLPRPLRYSGAGVVAGHRQH